MNTSAPRHIEKTIRLLEQELEAIDQRRGEIVRAIDTLRPLAGERTKAHRGRTDGRTDGAKRRPTRGATRSLPNVKGDAILATLKKHGGVMTPRALAAALGLKSTSTLSYQLKPLAKAKRITLTGTTADRQVSLPGRAKEAP